MSECETILSSKTKTVSITPSGPVTPIGERCNALGYRNVKQAVQRNDFSIFAKRASAQEKAGAQILNVNVVCDGVDETHALLKAMEAMTGACECPISIDFCNPLALDAALSAYKGRALINSINGETEKMAQVLPLMAKHKAAAIALLVDDNHGISMDVDERLRIAEKIIKEAKPYGLGVGDFIFDAVVLGAATEPQSARLSFETMRRLRENFNCNITLGASNAAYGMPDREYFNAQFLCVGVVNGCNVPITDPTLPELKRALLAAEVLRGVDEYSINYITYFREQQAAAAAGTAKAGAL
jgi:5-methyltetrahydrofolate--homocysteine methyltransferase